MIQKFFRLISIIFQPVLVPTFAFILLMQLPPYSHLPFLSGYKWLVLFSTFIFTGVIPGFTVLLMMRWGFISDTFIYNRNERTVPYLISVIAYVAWILFLWKLLLMPTFVIQMIVGATLALIAVMLINRFWKISAHLTSMGCVVGGAFAITYQMGIAPIGVYISLILLSGLVIMSRLYLKAHTPMQTFCGFVLGVISTFLPVYLF